MGVDHRWFESYLSERSQVVSINGVMSSKHSILNGVPQGSLLAPILYLCYCNDMVTSVNSKLILYADDSIIMAADKDPVNIANKLSFELDSCNRWLVDNKLSLHLGKCETLLFSSKRKCKNFANFSVRYKDQVISAKDNIKYLGMVLDQSLTGENMVCDIVKKSNSRLKFLYRHSRYLSKSTRKLLCSALIQSHIDYASMAWYFGLKTCHKKKLQILQNKMVRFIYSFSPRHHLNLQDFHDVGYLHIENRVIQLTMNVVHNIYHSNGPSYLDPFFVRVQHFHQMNTRSSNHNFVVPAINKVFFLL